MSYEGEPVGPCISPIFGVNENCIRLESHNIIYNIIWMWHTNLLYSEFYHLCSY